ncbi:MAG: flagellar hook-length control protein FliK [Paracoccus sp. (in: a-proteobacteria)]|uniref:flagellar hook-length control protein FliK n=1 Tax=Paracoccus sp. TaxID=267 RepID=UPI00391C5242
MTEMIRSLAAFLRAEPMMAEGDRPPSDEGDEGFSTGPDEATAMPDIVADTASPPLRGDPLRTWLEDLAGISAELAPPQPPPVTDTGSVPGAVVQGGLTDSTTADMVAAQAAGDMLFTADVAPMGTDEAPLAHAERSAQESLLRVSQPLAGQTAQTGAEAAQAQGRQAQGTGAMAGPEPISGPQAALAADPAQQADPVATDPVATVPATTGRAVAAAGEPLTRTDAPPAQDLRNRTDSPAPTAAAPARMQADAGAGALAPAQVGAQIGATATPGGAVPQQVAGTAETQAAPTARATPDQLVADRRQADTAMGRHPVPATLRDPASPAPDADAEADAETSPQPARRMTGQGGADEPADARKAAAPTPSTPDAAPDRIARAAPASGLTAHDPQPAEPVRMDGAFAPGIRFAGPATALTPHGDAGRPEAVAPILRQISGALVTTRGGVTEIALAPEELGRLHMVLTGHDRPQLVLWAERPETLEMLRRNVDLLTAELRDAGVEAGLLDFRDGPPPDMPDPPREDGTAGGQDSHETRTMATALTAALAIETGRPASARRIDVRL